MSFFCEKGLQKCSKTQTPHPQNPQKSLKDAFESCVFFSKALFIVFIDLWGLFWGLFVSKIERLALFPPKSPTCVSTAPWRVDWGLDHCQKSSPKVSSKRGPQKKWTNQNLEPFWPSQTLVFFEILEKKIKMIFHYVKLTRNMLKHRNMDFSNTLES